MTTTKVCTRRYNKKTYIFYINKPSYTGEKGIFGIEIEPYISVETPPDCFGYVDSILFTNNGRAYPVYKHIAPWILRRIEQVATRLSSLL